MPIRVIGTTGWEFYGRLKDADGADVDLTGATVYVRFFAPDGLHYKKDAELRDSSAPTATDIKYLLTDATEMAKIGGWLFTIGATLSGGAKTESDERERVWVIR